MGKLMVLIAANPYLALGAAIAMVVLGLMKWSTAGEKIIGFQERLSQINTQVNHKYAQQAAEIKKLVWMIENENLSNEQRIGYIEELKKLMPDYNGQLTTEGELVKHNKKAIDDYIVSLKEKIRFLIFEEEYTELLKKQMEAENSLAEAQRKQAEAQYAAEQAKGMPRTVTVAKGFGLGLPLGGTELPTELGKIERALDSANDEVEEATTSLNTYSDALLELEARIKKTSSVITTTGGGGGGEEMVDNFQLMDK